MNFFKECTFVQRFTKHLHNLCNCLLQLTEVAQQQMEKAIVSDYTGVEKNVATETIDQVQEEVGMG